MVSGSRGLRGNDRLVLDTPQHPQEKPGPLQGRNMSAWHSNTCISSLGM